MTDPKAEADKEALKIWYKEVLDAVVKEMIRIGAVKGAAVEATPVWAAPEQVLIAKVWPATQKRNFIWTISGNGATTDHLAGSLASTPREVARHFSLKWQVDAERLLNLAKSRAPDANTRTNVEAYAHKMIQNAEALYDLVSRDQGWE
jgi:hypothetical protein